MGGGEGRGAGFGSLGSTGLTRAGKLWGGFGGGSSIIGGTVVVRMVSVDGIGCSKDDGRCSVTVRARDWKDRSVLVGTLIIKTSKRSACR